MSEVWTESQPLLSVTELSSMLLILICQRPACDIAASTARDTIPMWEQKLQTTEAIQLFAITIHVPAKLPQVQLCRHASSKDLQCSHSWHWWRTVSQARPPCMRQVERQHMRTKLCVSSVFMYTYLPGLNAGQNQLLFVISASLPWKTTGLL